MKLFSYIGTRNTENSNTQKLLSLYLHELNKQHASDEWECVSYSSSDINVNACRGCATCFQEGFCPLDKVDFFNKIKKEMLSADIIILGSPVYAANVSGDMKIFIDRLSYWLHLMRLSGKIGVMLLSASSNSLMETGSYLKRMMESWGLSVVNEILCTSDAPKMLDSPQFKNVIIPQYVSTLMEYISGKKISASVYQERYFKTLQSAYDAPDYVSDAEVMYWRKNNLLHFDKYNDYLNYIS